jgi:hypothetical protein
MNSNRKRLTIVALVVFVIAVLFARWDLTGSPDHSNVTTCSPIFAPPDLGPWGKRELASRNFWTWLAIGVIYAGLYALLGEPKLPPSKKSDGC